MQKIITGIDVGSFGVKVVIAEVSDSSPYPRVIGVGQAKSSGVRNGIIVELDEVIQSIKNATATAQRASGVVVQEAFVSYGGAGLQELHSNSKLHIARTEAEISYQDLDELKHLARQKLRESLVNREVLHSVRVKTFLNDEEVFTDPVGMMGSKLQAEYFFITAIKQHVQDLKTAIEEVGIEVIEVVATPIATSLVALNKQYTIPGCALIDIGAQSTMVTVFEEDNPILLKTFPVGSANVTHDLALNLQIPITQAEQLKMGSLTDAQYSSKKINDIISARYRDIFKLIQEYLKENKKAGLLPAGVILIGGGALSETALTVAKQVLKIPVQKAQSKTKFTFPPTMLPAYGLCVYGSQIDSGYSLKNGVIRPLLSFVKKFIPYLP